MEVSYEHVYAMNKEQARRQLVQTYEQTGSIAQTARLWANGVSPWRKLRELGLQAPVEFALLPRVVLDRIAAHWLLGPGNDLLTCYKHVRKVRPLVCRHLHWAQNSTFEAELTEAQRERVKLGFEEMIDEARDFAVGAALTK